MYTVWFTLEECVLSLIWVSKQWKNVRQNYYTVYIASNVSDHLLIMTNPIQQKDNNLLKHFISKSMQKHINRVEIWELTALSCTTSICRTVFPFVSCIFGSAPFATSRRTHSSWPRHAANPSGYSPKYTLLKISVKQAWNYVYPAFIILYQQTLLYWKSDDLSETLHCWKRMSSIVWVIIINDHVALALSLGIRWEFWWDTLAESSS